MSTTSPPASSTVGTSATANSESCGHASPPESSSSSSSSSSSDMMASVSVYNRISCESHHDTLCESLWSRLIDGECCDCHLSGGGGDGCGLVNAPSLIRCHRLVLSALSPYFHQLFDTIQSEWHPFPITYCPVIILKEFSHETLCHIVQFCYKGEITVHQDELDDVLKAANYFQIRGANEWNIRPSSDSSSINISSHLSMKQTLSNNTWKDGNFKKRIIMRNRDLHNDTNHDYTSTNNNNNQPHSPSTINLKFIGFPQSDPYVIVEPRLKSVGTLTNFKQEQPLHNDNIDSNNNFNKTEHTANKRKQFNLSDTKDLVKKIKSYPDEHHNDNDDGHYNIRNDNIQTESINLMKSSRSQLLLKFKSTKLIKNKFETGRNKMDMVDENGTEQNDDEDDEEINVVDDIVNICRTIDKTNSDGSVDLSIKKKQTKPLTIRTTNKNHQQQSKVIPNGKQTPQTKPDYINNNKNIPINSKSLLNGKGHNSINNNNNSQNDQHSLKNGTSSPIHHTMIPLTSEDDDEDNEEEEEEEESQMLNVDHNLHCFDDDEEGYYVTEDDSINGVDLSMTNANNTTNNKNPIARTNTQYKTSTSKNRRRNSLYENLFSETKSVDDNHSGTSLANLVNDGPISSILSMTSDAPTLSNDVATVSQSSSSSSFAAAAAAAAAAVAAARMQIMSQMLSRGASGSTNAVHQSATLQSTFSLPTTSSGQMILTSNSSTSSPHINNTYSSSAFSPSSGCGSNSNTALSTVAARAIAATTLAAASFGQTPGLVLPAIGENSCPSTSSLVPFSPFNHSNLFMAAAATASQTNTTQQPQSVPSPAPSANGSNGSSSGGEKRGRGRPPKYGLFYQPTNSNSSSSSPQPISASTTTGKSSNKRNETPPKDVEQDSASNSPSPPEANTPGATGLTSQAANCSLSISSSSSSSSSSGSLTNGKANCTTATSCTVPINQNRSRRGRPPTLSVDDMVQRMTQGSNGVTAGGGGSSSMNASNGSQRSDKVGQKQCPHCPQVYYGYHAMHDHITSVHLNSNEKYPCHLCDKEYSWRITLRKHLKSQHGVHPDVLNS